MRFEQWNGAFNLQLNVWESYNIGTYFCGEWAQIQGGLLILRFNTPYTVGRKKKKKNPITKIYEADSSYISFVHCEKTNR